MSDKDNDNWFIGLVYSLHAVMDYYRYVYTLLQVGTVRPGQMVPVGKSSWRMGVSVCVARL